MICYVTDDDYVYYAQVGGRPVPEPIARPLFLNYVSDECKFFTYATTNSLRLISDILRSKRGFTVYSKQKPLRRADNADLVAFAARDPEQWLRLPNTAVTFYDIARLWRHGDHADAVKHFSRTQLVRLLKFIPSLNVTAVTELFSLIIDPRLFRSQMNPNRLSKLKRFCGLTLYQQERISNGVVENRADYMCNLVRRCWADIDFEVKEYNFLNREQLLQQDTIKGDLKASEKFLTYFTLVWQSMTSNYNAFDPSIFFNRADLDKFERYVNNLV